MSASARLGKIASHLELNYETVRQVIKKLDGRYVAVRAAKNQHELTQFTILKYKTVRDFAPSTSADSTQDGSNGLLPAAEWEAKTLPPEKSGKQRRNNSRNTLIEQYLSDPNNNSNKKKKENPCVESKDSTGSSSSFSDSRCSHDPCCKSVPWHICRIIAEASGLESTSFPPKDLSNAKALRTVPDDEIRGTVLYMIETGGDFWNRKRRINPAAVQDSLPLYRKRLPDQRQPPGAAADLNPLDTLAAQGVAVCR